MSIKKGRLRSSGLLATPVQFPPGTVISFAGSTAPEGWMLCDGAAISRTQYAALFAAIGTTWGNGNGSTTFHLPDLRGRFLRGVDGTAGRDPNKATRTAANAGGNAGNAVGSVQDDRMQNHNHHYIYRERDGTRPPGSTVDLADSTGYRADSDMDRIRYFTETSGPTGRFTSETRPLNAYVNYIIKI